MGIIKLIKQHIKRAKFNQTVNKRVERFFRVYAELLPCESRFYYPETSLLVDFFYPLGNGVWIRWDDFFGGGAKIIISDDGNIVINEGLVVFHDKFRHGGKWSENFFNLLDNAEKSMAEKLAMRQAERSAKIDKMLRSFG